MLLKEYGGISSEYTYTDSGYCGCSSGIDYDLSADSEEKMGLKYALLWIVLAVSILILGCFPQLITWIAHFFGVQIPINMLFFIGFCFSLLIIFSLSAALSRNSEKIKKLTQEMGLLEKKLNALEKSKE